MNRKIFFTLFLLSGALVGAPLLAMGEEPEEKSEASTAPEPVRFKKASYASMTREQLRDFLTEAIKQNRKDDAVEVASLCPDILFMEDWVGTTPMKRAVSFGDLETVTLLLNLGVGRRRAHQLQPLLIMAIRKHKPELVNVILRAGASVLWKIVYDSAFDSLERVQSKAVESGPLGDKLSSDARQVLLLIVRQLLAEHSDKPLISNLMRVASNGQNVLHFSAQEGALGLIEPLMLLGIDVNGQDARGNTPLHYATAINDEAVIQALLSSPLIDVNLANRQGSTALMMAAKNNNSDMINALLLRGANPYMRDFDGNTVWHYAEDRPEASMALAAATLRGLTTGRATRAAEKMLIG